MNAPRSALAPTTSTWSGSPDTIRPADSRPLTERRTSSRCSRPASAPIRTPSSAGLPTTTLASRSRAASATCSASAAGTNRSPTLPQTSWIEPSGSSPESTISSTSRAVRYAVWVPALAERLDRALGEDRVVRQFAPGLAGVAEQDADAAIDVELGIAQGRAGAGGQGVKLLAVLPQQHPERLQQRRALVEGQLAQRRAARRPAVGERRAQVDAGR